MNGASGETPDTATPSMRQNIIFFLRNRSVMGLKMLHRLEGAHVTGRTRIRRRIA